MQKNKVEKQRTPENGTVVQCEHLHPRGHAHTMINPLSSKDYKRSNRYYTLNDSFIDNDVIALNLLRGNDQEASLDLNVSFRSQKDLFSKNQSEISFQYITTYHPHPQCLKNSVHTLKTHTTTTTQIVHNHPYDLTPHLPYLLTTINVDPNQFFHITAQPKNQ